MGAHRAGALTCHCDQAQSRATALGAFLHGKQFQVLSLQIRIVHRIEDIHPMAQQGRSGWWNNVPEHQTIPPGGPGHPCEGRSPSLGHIVVMDVLQSFSKHTEQALSYCHWIVRCQAHLLGTRKQGMHYGMVHNTFVIEDHRTARIPGKVGQGVGFTAFTSSAHPGFHTHVIDLSHRFDKQVVPVAEYAHFIDIRGSVAFGFEKVNVRFAVVPTIDPLPRMLHNSLKITALIMVATAWTGCMTGPCVKGGGDVGTRNIAAEPFHAIIVQGPMDIQLEPAGEHALKVEAPNTWADLIATEVRDGVLTITMDGCIRGPGSLVVHVAAPSLESVTLEGSGHIKGTAPPPRGPFKIELQGSGDIDLAIIAVEVGATVRGSGDIRLRGSANTFNGRVLGSGDIKAQDLESNMAQAEVRGSGDIILHAKESLSARISGSGDIRYLGEPEIIEKDVKGSGDIRQAQ